MEVKDGAAHHSSPQPMKNHAMIAILEPPVACVAAATMLDAPSPTHATNLNTLAVVCNPSDVVNNPLTFVAGDGGVATKFKKSKHKTLLTENVVDSLNGPINVNPCNIATGLIFGEKKKLLGNMIVGDNHNFDDFGSKKSELNDSSENGSNVDIVEAEVGCNQPTESYENFVLELSGHG